MTELQPMNVGEILDRTFRIYGEQFKSYLTIAALGMAAALVLYLLSDFFIPVPSLHPSLGLSLVRLGPVYLIMFVVVLIDAAIIKKTSLHIMGQPISVADCYRFTLRRTGRVFVAGLLLVLAVLGGFILLIIPGIYFFIRYSLSLQTLIIEDRGAAGALSRSRKLIRGSWWRVFGILFLISLLMAVFTGVIEVPLNLFLLHRILTEHIGATVIMQVVVSIVNTFAIPFSGIAYTLLYYDLRVRKENLDLETMVDNLTGGPVDAVQA